MSWKKLRHFAIGAVIALLLIVPLAGFAFVKSGIYDVAASWPHTKFTTWLTHETMIHSVRRHAKGIAAPASFSTAQAAAGLCAYRAHCAACHGAAGVPREEWVSGLEPQPPYLLDISQQFTSSELFWIVRNGIKMTGMPSWRDSMSEEESWAVVAWLEASRDLPPQTYVRWSVSRRCASSPAIRPGSP